MADTLKIDIDVQAARKSLGDLTGSFNTFKQAANNATAGAGEAVKRLNDAISKLRAIDPNILAGLSAINQTLAQLNSGNLTVLADALGKFGASSSSVQATAEALKATQSALANLQPPAGLSSLSVKFTGAATGANQLTAAQKALAAQQRATASAVKTLGDELLNAGGFMAGVGVTAGKIASALNTLAQGGITAGEVFQGLQQKLGGFGAVAAVFTGVVVALKALYSVATSIISPILEVGSAFNSFRLTIDAVDGSGAGAETLAKLGDMANRTAQDITVLANNFKGFRAATEASGLSADESLKIYEQFSTAFGALGLNAQKTEKGFLALTQMFSKGKVQAEELRGQLGDALPGAFVFAAESMGITTAALDAMLKQGLVTADVLIPKLGKFLELKFAGAIAEQVKTAAGQLVIFGNHIKALQENLAQGNFGGVLGGVAEGMARINEAVSSEGLRLFTRVMGDLIGLLANVVLSTLGSVANGFGLFFDAIAGGITIIGNFITPLKDAIKYLKENNTVMSAVSTAIQIVGNALGIAIAAWFAFGGAMKIARLAASALSIAFGGILKSLTSLIPSFAVASAGATHLGASLGAVNKAQAASAGNFAGLSARIAAQGGLWASLKKGAESTLGAFKDFYKNGLVAATAGFNIAYSALSTFGTALLRLSTSLVLPGLAILLGTLIALREPLAALAGQAYEWAKSLIFTEAASVKAATAASLISEGFTKLAEQVQKTPEKLADTVFAFNTFEGATKSANEELERIEDKLKANAIAFADDAEAMKEANAPLEKLKATLDTYGVALDDSSIEMVKQMQQFGASKDSATSLVHSIQELSKTEAQRADELRAQIDKSEEAAAFYLKLAESTQRVVDSDKELLASGDGVKEVLEKRIALGEGTVRATNGIAAANVLAATSARVFEIAALQGIGVQEAMTVAIEEASSKYGVAVDEAKLYAEVQKQLTPTLDATKTATEQAATSQEKLNTAADETKVALEASKTSLDSSKTAVETLSTALSTAQTSFDTANTALTSIATASTNLKTSVDGLVTAYPALISSTTSYSALIAPMTEAMTPLVAAFSGLSVQLTAMNTALPTINTGLSQMSATLLTLAPVVQQTALAFESLKTIPATLDAAKTSLDIFIGVLELSIEKLNTVKEAMSQLAETGDKVKTGFETAVTGAGAFIDELGRVESAVDSLITKMLALQEAAEAALRASSRAQSQTGGGGGGGQRDGGYSEENVYKSSSLIGSDLLKTAPSFADGTANTSSQVSRLAGGGIPSILHPNEAVVPLPKGRKIPVDLNLELAQPPATSEASSGSVDSAAMQSIATSLDSVAQGLNSIATAMSNVAPSLARTSSVDSSSMGEAIDTLSDRLSRQSSDMGTIRGVNGDFSNGSRISEDRASSPNGLTTPRLSSVSEQNSRTGPATKEPASNLTVNINIKTDDVEGFRRSEDQVVRRLSDKIRRANRRNG